MATVTKDFKVKSGLIVEGATATVNNYDILTKKAEDQSYIVDLIGGTATPNNTADSVVKRDANGNFAAGTITADLQGDVTATTLTLNDGASNSSVYAGGSDLTVYGHNNLYLNTNNADIILQPDGYAKIYGDIIATQPYADQVAGTAQSAAESFATSADTALYGTVTADIATAKTQAETYAEGLVSQEATDRYTAITNAINTEVQDRNDAINASAQNTLDTANTNAQGYATTAENNAKAYTDQEVAALVDAAPAMLDTLNELAAAIADNPNYATDVSNLVATKADTSYVNSEISGANAYAETQADNAETAAKAYADSLASNYDAAGAAITAYNNATDYTDSAITAEVTNRNNAIDSAISNVNLTIDNLNTDGVDEGIGNLYFTDARAKDSAAALLTTATLTNLTITGTGNGGLVITAENGVADSTTDDLDEGTNNLYFTDARAVSALEAVVPNFTEIDLNDIVTKVATQVSVPTASQITAHEFDSTVYRSAEYTVKVAYGSHSELSKVMLTLDSSNNIAITEYAVVGTNGSASTVTADINAGNVRLRVTPTNNNSVVTVFGTIIK